MSRFDDDELFKRHGLCRGRRQADEFQYPARGIGSFSPGLAEAHADHQLRTVENVAFDAALPIDRARHLILSGKDLVTDAVFAVQRMHRDELSVTYIHGQFRPSRENGSI
jgi:hypothetical protein